MRAITGCLIACCFASFACSDAAAPRPGGLQTADDTLAGQLQGLDILGGVPEFRARLGGDSLVSLVAYDPDAVPDSIGYGGCAFAARVYAGVAYQQNVWQSSPHWGAFACPDYSILIVVPPHDSLVIAAVMLNGLPPDTPAAPPGLVRLYLVVKGQLIALDAGVRHPQ